MHAQDARKPCKTRIREALALSPCVSEVLLLGSGLRKTVTRIECLVFIKYLLRLLLSIYMACSSSVQLSRLFVFQYTVKNFLGGRI